MLPHILNSNNGDTELDRARRENEMLKAKLHKAISKKDYYAKLYYSCVLERDKATAEREGAIRELQRALTQLHQQGYDLSPNSDCLSDGSGSNLVATPLTLSSSLSLASLLSYFHSHPSTSLPSPVEDSGLCTGGSTSSLPTNKESLNSSPNDLDTLSPHAPTSILSPPSTRAISVTPSKKGPDVSNLLIECAEALEGIADLGLKSNNRSEYKTYEQLYGLETHKKQPRVSPLIYPTASLSAKKFGSKPPVRDPSNLVDTFDNFPVSWPRPDRKTYTRPTTLDTIPTSLLEEYVQDSVSPLVDTRQHSADRRTVHNTTSTLDRIEEMSCESSVSDQSTELKPMEPHVLLQRPDFTADSNLISDRTESTHTNKKKLSYGNLNTYELRQILFELSTSAHPGNYLEFYRSSFEDEWVLLLLCDEIKRNTCLTVLHLVECNLHMTNDGLVQLFTAVTRSKLTFLSLARNGLTDRVVDSFRITDIFNSRMNLEFLDLSENFLSPEAVEILTSLKGNLRCELILHKQFIHRSRSNLRYQLL